MINENKIRQIYKSNREQGFQLLVECFQEPIYYYIRRLVVLHEDAEDVLQEVFIQVYRHWEQFRCESSLSTWIYRIATNESLRLLNSRKRRETVSTEDIQENLIFSLKASDYVGSVSLSPEDERIGRYLRGETLLLEPGEATREKGWILVCVDQYALGWGKLVNGVLKNKYWSGWRLKS